MTAADLLWPGQDRAEGVFDDAAVTAAMVRVETAWARALEGAALAEPGAADALMRFAAGPDDVTALAREAEAGGNPVIPLVARLRSHVRESAPASAGAVHRGLTSQDVLDSALMLCSAEALEALAVELDRQDAALTRLVAEHRDTLMAARTLGQHALPTTFGARAATWLRGVRAAAAEVRECRAGLPVQLGGAAGTLAATVEVCRAAGSPDPVASARDLVGALALALALQPAAPWHTVRCPVTAVGDTLVAVSDALGHIANDVALLSRPELGELSEPAAEGRGVSSAMPQKRNPVLAVLIRRHSASAPLLGAQLHLAAAGAVDERPDGAWHAEWAALRDLARRTVAAARQATELVEGLQVHTVAMRANLDAGLPALLAERLVPALAPLLHGGRDEATSLVTSAGGVAPLREGLRARLAPGTLTDGDLDALLDPAGYLGICGWLVNDVLGPPVPSPPETSRGTEQP